MTLERPTSDRLAGLRQAIDAHDQVDVDRADDEHQAAAGVRGARLNRTVMHRRATTG
ncbi:MAG: hypothetical protein ACYC91_08715 [Solirubrobacteraceae bacterium]